MTDRTQADLLPCPFCGGDLSASAEDIDCFISHVECDGCDMRGPISEWKHPDPEEAKADAINRWNVAWNRRATPAEAVPSDTVVVPREPTEAMIEAACGPLLKFLTPEEEQAGPASFPLATWRAMLSAAPRTAGEPVAWRARLGSNPRWVLLNADPTGEPSWHSAQPLYTHPATTPATPAGGELREKAARAVYAKRPASLLHPEERDLTWEEAQTEVPGRIATIYSDVDAILAALQPQRGEG